MASIQRYREMTPTEVARIHRVRAAIGLDIERAIEAIADLRAYCGSAWPTMLQDALRRYERSRRGDDVDQAERSA